jgi:hypothetical protein
MGGCWWHMEKGWRSQITVSYRENCARKIMTRYWEDMLGMGRQWYQFENGTTGCRRHTTLRLMLVDAMCAITWSWQMRNHLACLNSSKSQMSDQVKLTQMLLPNYLDRVEMLMTWYLSLTTQWNGTLFTWYWIRPPSKIHHDHLLRFLRSLTWGHGHRY